MIGARDTTVAAIAGDEVGHRHPEYGSRDVDEAARRLFLGAELANRIGRPLLSDT